ncbi:hypothetical protein GCM10009792_15760 [Microcella alkalica]|uniref:hypothetical protein n=1 Tax=Microcella alkalica TaxID=355930 RepID=UPI0031E09F2F
MQSLRQPVGPLPPQVYWRRRLVVGIGLLAVILIVVLILVRPGAEQAGASNPDAPAASEPPADEAGAADEPAQPADPANPNACTPDQVQVAAVTDADSYPAEVQPLLSLTLTNTGSTPCVATVGTDVQEYVITSGSDRIWSSTDCQQNPSPAEVTLEPGAPLSTTPFSWQRVRSEPGGACEGERTAAIGGGATYRLTVTIGGLTSEAKPFVLQ